MLVTLPLFLTLSLLLSPHTNDKRIRGLWEKYYSTFVWVLGLYLSWRGGEEEEKKNAKSLLENKIEGVIFFRIILFIPCARFFFHWQWCFLGRFIWMCLKLILMCACVCVLVCFCVSALFCFIVIETHSSQVIFFVTSHLKTIDVFTSLNLACTTRRNVSSFCYSIFCFFSFARKLHSKIVKGIIKIILRSWDDTWELVSIHNKKLVSLQIECGIYYRACERRRIGVEKGSNE